MLLLPNLLVLLTTTNNGLLEELKLCTNYYTLTINKLIRINQLSFLKTGCLALTAPEAQVSDGYKWRTKRSIDKIDKTDTLNCLIVVVALVKLVLLN